MLNDSTKRVRCPLNKTHEEFSAMAHVTELWKVNDQADFLEVIEGIETTHAPDEQSVYQCHKCGSEGVIVTIVQPRKCANCDRLWNKDELEPIHKIEERVDEGEVMPSGECPACHALCYILDGRSVKEKP